ncbi:hypothetical protein OG762_40870 [Streptomyces sp. NBC_01136]|uniref:hypothetical protein n=1 Tax=unclassified Streptomyces TaxID=2593676 RepID=UPI00325115BC|nr:hypothetical protein OG762_40870 [Streptomyces sp. NBC_01136]
MRPLLKMTGHVRESGVAGMARLMATATCTAFSGVLEGSGERVGQRVLLERVGFLAQLSRELAGALVAARWDEDSLDVLAAGVDEPRPKSLETTGTHRVPETLPRPWNGLRPAAG